MPDSTAPVLDRVRALAEQQNALDKRNAIDGRITDAFQRAAHAGVVLSLVEYVQANEAWESIDSPRVDWTPVWGRRQEARARLFSLLEEKP